MTFGEDIHITVLCRISFPDYSHMYSLCSAIVSLCLIESFAYAEAISHMSSEHINEAWSSVKDSIAHWLTVLQSPG